MSRAKTLGLLSALVLFAFVAGAGAQGTIQRFSAIFINGNRITAPAGTGVITLPNTTTTLAGTDNAVTLTNKTLDAESTGNTVTLPFTVYQRAGTCYDEALGGGGSPDAYVGFFNLPLTNNPTKTCLAESALLSAVLEYPDSGTARAFNEFRLPADWSGAIDVVIEWYSPATTGNVMWILNTACVAVGESLDASWNTDQQIVDATQGTTNRMNTASQTGVTTTGCAAGEHLFYRLWRDPSNGSDTLTNSAYMIGVEWTLRRAM